MHQQVIEWLATAGIRGTNGLLTAAAIGIGAIALLAAVAQVVGRRLVLVLLQRLVALTETDWDDALFRRRVFVRLARLAPAIVVYVTTPLYFSSYPKLCGGVRDVALIYVLLVALGVFDALLNAVVDIYGTFERSKQVPIKGYVQVAKLVLFIVGGIAIVSILLDKTPIYLLSGLGALTAVLLLIFKDPILGLVAGIQLSGNKMVAIGDWIEMPSHGADGTVIEVALTTVKVQNWDKTVTTLPTYSLISDSFKNWRGMSESGGRRIKRALRIDLNSIRFLAEQDLERLRRIQHISEYLQRKRTELAQHNQQHAVDDASLVNGRRLTNVGTFRAYVEAYLRGHPMISQQMTFLVRQLQPDEHGLPLEIYVFSKDQEWANYEAIQADIFDHILAAVPEFDLRVFQSPSGSDLRGLASGPTINAGPAR